MYKIILLFLLLLSVFFYYNANPIVTKFDKVTMLDYIDIKYRPKHILVNKNNFHKHLLDKIHYPIIFKPNNCHNFSHGVKLIKNKLEALDYIINSNDSEIIIQDYHQAPKEATILYTKHPLTKKVNIYVIERKHKNKETNFIYKPKSMYKSKSSCPFFETRRKDLETTNLKNTIQKISSKFPYLSFGRYDIKYTSDELLKNTKDFKIIELNDLPQDDFSFSFINTIKRVEYGFWNIMLNNVTLNDSLYHIYKKISKLNTCNQDKYYKNILMNIV